MTERWIRGESSYDGPVTDPEHDALYSNPEKQREHLEAKGHSEEEIEEFLRNEGRLEEEVD